MELGGLRKLGQSSRSRNFLVGDSFLVRIPTFLRKKL